MARTPHGFSVTLLAVLAAGAKAQEDSVIVCHERPGLTVSLRCRAAASPADRDWLQLEFDNRTDAPLMLAGCSWCLDGAQVRDAAGTPLRQSSLAQGNHLDLFHRSEAPWSVALAPGVTRVATPISDYATALLGVPDREQRVTARVVVRIALDDEPLVHRGETGDPFRFRWLPPDDDGLTRMRGTLAELLRVERPAIGSLYLVGTLLGCDAVGGTWKLEDLLALPRPPRAYEPFHPWNTVLQHLDARFAADVRLADWALARFRARDPAILADLQRMPKLWRADFIPELMRDWPTQPAARERLPTPLMHILPMLLEQRGAPQRGDDALCAALAAPWVRVLGDVTPARLDSTPREHRITRAREVAQALRALGHSRDRQQLDRLAPWLDCTVALHDGAVIGRSPTIPPDPDRIDEVACDAILMVLGDDPEGDYRKHLDAAGLLFVRPDPATRARQLAALRVRVWGLRKG